MKERKRIEVTPETAREVHNVLRSSFLESATEDVMRGRPRLAEMSRNERILHEMSEADAALYQADQEKLLEAVLANQQAGFALEIPGHFAVHMNDNIDHVKWLMEEAGIIRPPSSTFYHFNENAEPGMEFSSPGPGKPANWTVLTFTMPGHEGEDVDDRNSLTYTLDPV